MKSSVLWGLIGLNAVLLFVFIAAPWRTSTAQAQVSRPSDYLLIPGEVPGGNSEVVYVIDTTNGKLMGLSYDNSTQTIQTLPALNLNNVFSGTRAPNGQGPRGY